MNFANIFFRKSDVKCSNFKAHRSSGHEVFIHCTFSCFTYAVLPYYVAFDGSTYSKEGERERKREKEREREREREREKGGSIFIYTKFIYTQSIQYDVLSFH